MPENFARKKGTRNADTATAGSLGPTKGSLGPTEGRPEPLQVDGEPMQRHAGEEGYTEPLQEDA